MARRLTIWVFAAGWVAGGGVVAALAQPAAINEMCPVMTAEKALPDFAVVYEGRTIGFCCARCVEKFQADPQKYVTRPMLAALLAAAPPGSQPATATTPISSGSARPSEDDSAAIAAAPPAPQGAARLIGWLGKFHPASTHLPIGLLLGAAAAELFLIATRRENFRSARQFCLWGASLGAVVTAALGWFLAESPRFDEPRLLAAHRWLGTALSVALCLVTALMLRADRRGGTAVRNYRIGLLLTVALTGSTGFLGGAMVWGLDHYRW